LIDLATGLFTYDKVDLVLPDVIPIVLRRTYRTLDGVRFHPFGYGSGASYQMYLVGDTTSYLFAELILPDGARIRYNRTSAGTDKVGAVNAPGRHGRCGDDDVHVRRRSTRWRR